jgi:hypothetical protein
MAPATQAIASGEQMGAGQAGSNLIQNAAQGYGNINPNISVNQGLQNTQQGLLNNALSQIQNGGLNAQSLGQLNAIRQQQNQATQAGQAAALSNAKQMGTTQGNSGILGSMVAGQQAANQATNQGFQTGQEALQNANAMLNTGSNMANNLQNQGLGVQQQNFANASNLQGAKLGAAGAQANALNNVASNLGSLTNATGAVGNQAFNQANSNGAPNWQDYTGGGAPSDQSIADNGWGSGPGMD